ncbi:MAG: hypothetical protein QM696_06310 [Steroidobacteraceae bacterium]
MKRIIAVAVVSASVAACAPPSGQESATAKPASWLDKAPPGTAKLIEAWQQGTWGFQGEKGCEYIFCWRNQLEYNAGAAPKYEIPLIPGGEMEKRWLKIRQDLKNGKMTFDTDARCLPSGVPGLLRSGGFRMIATNDRIYFIYGGSQQYRIIWMDGRKIEPKEDYQLTFNGDSVGHWDEKGRLVIDTTNIRGDDKIVGPHLPMSNNFWTKEVLTPVADNRIETEVTMMDVDNWTRPHVEHWSYNRNPEGDLAPQQVCITGEGQRYINDGTGDYVLSGPGGKPLEQAED